MHPECSEILNTYIIQRKPEKYNGFFEFSFRTAGYFPARVVLWGGGAPPPHSRKLLNLQTNLNDIWVAPPLPKSLSGYFNRNLQGRRLPRHTKKFS